MSLRLPPLRSSSGRGRLLGRSPTIRLRALGRASTCLAVLLTACAGESDPPITGSGGLTDGGVADTGRPGSDTGTNGGDGGPASSVDSGAPLPDGGCGGSRADAPLVRSPVDVIWAMDQSLSMVDEAYQVTVNINEFANNIANSGANVRMVMVTSVDPAAGSPLAMDPARYRSVFSLVQSNNAFDELINTFPTYRDFLRADAPTHFVVITDDSPGLLMNGDQFRTQMEALLGHEFIFHAIANPPTNSCLGAFGSGAQYFTLAEQTGGQGIPVCSPDWTAVFSQLESAVVSSAPLPCDFAIPAPPAGETLDPAAVKVVYTRPDMTESEFPRADTGDVCGQNLGWYYSPTKDKVLLCPAACEAARAGGTIDVAFGCAPTVLR